MKLLDCFNYYPLVQWSKFAEIEIIGDFLTHNDDSKICCSEIFVLKELSFETVLETIKEQNITDSNGVTDSRGVTDSNEVSYSNGVNSSRGVTNSNGVNNSRGVTNSNGVSYSNGVNNSSGVSYSRGVTDSRGVTNSSGVTDSNGVNNSNGVSYSRGVSYSNGVNSSRGVNNSNGVSYSSGVNNSNGVNNSSGVTDSNGVNNSNGVRGIFVSNYTSQPLLFNRLVSEERYDEVMTILNLKLNHWEPTFNNLKSLYLKSGEIWEQTPITSAKSIQKEEAYKDMPKEAIEYLKSLPEFDIIIFEKVTGIKIEVND